MRKIILPIISVVAFIAVTTTGVGAQSLLPEPLQNLLELLGPNGEGSSQFIQSRVSTLLLLFLGVIILAAVVYTAFAAFKYIRSQGEEGEIESARKGIEAIFQGIALMMIAIVGIVLIFVFFGADLFSPSIYQVCIAAPNSPGCNACTDSEGGLRAEFEDAKFATSLDKFVVQYKVDLDDIVNALTNNTSNVDDQAICGGCEWAYFQSSRDNKPTGFDESATGFWRVCFE